MINIGEKQVLIVMRKANFGVYLNEDGGNENNDILLPNKQVPEGILAGDEVEVFVYKDSEDRPIATMDEPLIHIGELAYLEVVEVTEIGAFLNWGLEKDLFLPFGEQTNKVKEGKKYLVALYLDKSERLCATMNITSYLEIGTEFKKEDTVKGTIFAVNEEIGAFVAIDNKYIGLIPEKEFYGNYSCGDEIEGRIAKVKEDGKVDIGLRQVAYKQMDVDAELIIEKLESNDGKLNLNDKSSPEAIKRELQMSKKAFKRAVGRLLKEKRIEFSDTGIKKIDENIE